MVQQSSQIWFHNRGVCMLCAGLLSRRCHAGRVAASNGPGPVAVRAAAGGLQLELRQQRLPGWRNGASNSGGQPLATAHMWVL
jgi:hypothetical protein